MNRVSTSLNEQQHWLFLLPAQGNEKSLQNNQGIFYNHPCQGKVSENIHFFKWSKSFSYREAALWNNLAIGVKQAPYLSVFKHRFFLDN